MDNNKKTKVERVKETNEKEGGEAYARPLLEWLQKPLEHLHG